MELHAVLYRVDPRERRERIEKLLRFVELWDRRADFVKRFSGGMKRRLEIARALLHEPKIMFLDEPTLGLDPQTRNHIWSYIENLSRERDVTVFFTTHYMEEADRVADEIAVIDHGKIVAQGSPASLKERVQTVSLEDAFIALTGHAIRDEEVTPLFFFSNALFPVDGFPAPLKLLIHVNPLSYGIDGLRGALSQAFLFGPAIDLVILGGVTAILLGVGSYLFSRIQL